jgi:hypothetical protein
MSLIESLFSLPAEMDQWIVLFYVALVLAGARIVEFVAKKHYERARDFAVRGFETSRRRTNTAARKANTSSCLSAKTKTGWPFTRSAQAASSAA